MPLCPTCRAEIAAADMNMAEGVGLCRACGALHRLSQFAEPVVSEDAIGLDMPAGCTLLDDEQGLHARCRMLSRQIAVIFSACVMFGALFLCVLSAHSITPVPASSMHVTLLCLLIGLGAALFVAHLWLCKLEVLTSNGRGAIIHACGLIRRIQRFDAASVRSVSIEHKIDSRHDDGAVKVSIVIEADTTLRFGVWLSDDHRRWLAAVLANRLTNQPR